MDDIYTIYYNSFGIAFRWKRGTAKNFNKIQLVFRDTGLFLTPKELIHFSENIKKALKEPYNREEYGTQNLCKTMLLEAPNPQTCFVMSYNELKLMDDLVQGSCFELNLNKLLENLTIS